ncbi:hypothetical protein ACFFMN_23335 [Planobispora siamensis]|uniref:Uncharacterized protein n=1 Tax=Planobispora siamensis TaxID=936338 RepID=A0A8J3WPX4_9ACTN|nr:hypothetical protein [Planobispora siamensis]GIH95296.1 hypothetical protein Psi01_59260 [Planobispora siamensis]
MASTVTARVHTRPEEFDCDEAPRRIRGRDRRLPRAAFRGPRRNRDGWFISDSVRHDR